jgi:hypothetical protein
MDHGDESVAINAKVLQFNGGLFQNADALSVTEEQLELLIEAAEREWKDVEPAIFGTLLERALDPTERHRLGAHYTPRAYVDRLVLPTIIEPLRMEWDAAKAAAFTLANRGEMAEAKDAIKTFHHRLCEIRVLDPACGSGNFLYATLEHMKRLEGEVLDFLTNELHEDQDYLDLERHSVDPHQFLGLEINPRAVAIAELVLWIGYLQWHFRTRGRVLPVEPILRNFHNIQKQDAILAYDAEELARDDKGKPLSRWDGIMMKKHPVTGEDVPDEEAQKPIYRYINPRKAEWPQADFIIGNPPFIGGKDLRADLGDGYTEALWAAHPDLPNSIDFVMYWWDKAAEIIRQGKAQRFGFITTNSLPQTFSRRVVARHLEAKPPLSIAFAIPDHPWVKALEGSGVRDTAAVRVAMTVGAPGIEDGFLCRVAAEKSGHSDGMDVNFEVKSGRIHADMKTGPNIAGCVEMTASSRLSSRGMSLHGAGFIVTADEAKTLGLGRIHDLRDHIRPYLNGRDLTGISRGLMVIDLFGIPEQRVRDRFPDVYQWVLERVKPERDHNNRATYRDGWWFFGEPRRELRPALHDLDRYIATVETSKHRTFQFLDVTILPDNKLVAIGLSDAFDLGILSSQVHVTWALAAGGHLGVGNDPVYVKTACFDKFPFPSCDDATKTRIRALGENLDRHRKDRQALYPDLTITGMYNVLEKLRAGTALDAKEKVIHEHGLVSVLKQIHDELDVAVAAAYDWPVDLSDDEILTRLVALNHERAAEEKRGLIRWLRPEFQAPVQAATQTDFDMGEAPKKVVKTKAAKQSWPKALPEQVQAIRAMLTASAGPAAAAEIAKTYTGARTDRIEEVLAALVALGQARRVGDRYAA